MVKKRCKKNPPQYENGTVRFKYMDNFIEIPVSKCMGGYDFVNMLCDKMEISRIYMEEFKL